MINEKMITDKKMIEHMKPIIARHYEDMFLKNASAEEKEGSNSYQEFKKLLSNNQEVARISSQALYPF
ncbi:MAG: hypothetical protein WCA39_16330 [Nitrososphaeraceae archaeon]|jgi:hypothetical protein